MLNDSAGNSSEGLQIFPRQEFIEIRTNLTDEELDRLEAIDFNAMKLKHTRVEHRIRREFRDDGAQDVIMLEADYCLLSGHRWLPEKMMTRWCSRCKLWEAL